MGTFSAPFSEQDPGTLDAFDRRLEVFFAANPNPEIEARLLNKMYEKEPCAHCRSNILERLLEMNRLTDALRRSEVNCPPLPT